MTLTFYDAALCPSNPNCTFVCLSADFLSRVQSTEAQYQTEEVCTQAGECTIGITWTQCCIIKAIPFLLFANREDIRFVNIETPNSNSSTILISNLEDVGTLDFYYHEGLIFWINFDRKTIKGMRVNDSKTPRNIITTGLLEPDGLACDWLGKKLYWTDSRTNRIEVSNFDGSYRKVLFWEDLDQPRAIALVPTDGLMFWINWGKMPTIERGSMDGNHFTRKVIVNDNIMLPNGLTVDYGTKRIFWTDAKLKIITGMDFDGNSRKTVLNRNLPYPFSVTVYQDKIYWTDWQRRAVLSCDKYNGKRVETVIRGSLSPMGIHVYIHDRQAKGPTPCDKNNGGCSHLCLMSSRKPYFSCACPTGVRLLNNNKTCAPGPEKILLLASQTNIRRISLDTADYTDVIIHLKGVRRAVAIDYDPIEHVIYWTDDEIQKIQRAHLNGSKQEDLITVEVSHPDGIAVDWVARNLYWTDLGTDRIEVSRLNGTSRKTLVAKNLDEPRAIALNPAEGYMYWTDWGTHPKIERAELDGTHRVSIVNSSLGFPNGLAVDYATRKLYWGDAKTDKIEMSNLDGSDRRVLVLDQLGHIYGFSLLGDYVYWTDWKQQSIERAHKITGDKRKVIVNRLPDVMGLKAANIYDVYGTNPCATRNGNCSNLCLNKPNGYICACPMDLELAPDLKTCIVPEAFLLISQPTAIRRVSLESKHGDVIPIPVIKDASALDYDINDNRIYWTDIQLKTINRIFMNGSSFEQIVKFGLEYPVGMAVDWVAQNLYWTDMGLKSIEVCRLDGSSRKVLLWQDLDDPRSLVLDPSDGYMYWSDWGSNPHIERSSMDGSERSKIATEIGKANSLTIDYEGRRLYWIDIENKQILSLDLKGGNQQKIVSTHLPQPYSLTLYRDYIYWVDWTTHSIERSLKATGENRTWIQDHLDYIVGIHIHHKSRKSGWNPCAFNNGGCSNLCFVQPSVSSFHYFCGCPTHYKLASDKKTCLSPKQYILFSDKNSIRQMIPDIPKTPDVIIPIPHIKNIQAIEYDDIEKFVYWIDGRTQTIYRRYYNGTSLSKVVHNLNALRHPYDMVIERYSRLLFWSCAQNDVIGVVKLNGDDVGVIVNGKDQKPRNIAIQQKKGLIFWTNLVYPPRIESASLDGGRKKIVISKGLVQPGAITVDSVQNLLFWSDLSAKRIETSNIDGSERKILVEVDVFQAISLIIFEQYLYWIDDHHQVIERANKITGQNRERIKNEMLHFTDLVAVSPAEDYYDHPCFINNGGCSHLCILNDTGDKYCSCPIDMIFVKNGRVCVMPPTCKSNQFRCHSGRINCIPKSWRCNDTAECEDMSDELNCSICKPYQYKCKNDKCIDKRLLCDGVLHCHDGDDEGAPHCKQLIEVTTMEITFETKANISTRFVVVAIIITLFIIIVLILMSHFFKMKSCEYVESEMDKIQVTTVLQPTVIPISCNSSNSSRNSCQTNHSYQIYEQIRVTGTSSACSTDTRYPQETLNPPPTPVTVLSQCSECSSYALSSNRSYKYRGTKNKLSPPPTPYNTESCDNSEPCPCCERHYNSSVRSSTDSDLCPPPTFSGSHFGNNYKTCPETPPPSPSFK